MPFKKISYALLAALFACQPAFVAEFEKGEDGGILIPANAEMLLYSGSINFAMPEGCGFRDAGKPECPAGDMEAQGAAILEGFQNRLEARGWSMENVVRVNVYGVADENGELDFAGFNRAFARYFSREEGGWYPARTFVTVAGLFRPELLVEVEILAMKVPD